MILLALLQLAFARWRINSLYTQGIWFTVDFSFASLVILLLVAFVSHGKLIL